MTPYGRMPYEQYTAIKAVNISTLLYIDTSPKHYQSVLQHPPKDKAAYRLGRLVHTAIFEPMQLMHEYVQAPYENFRTKDAQNWKAEQEANGKTVITAAQFEQASRIQMAIRNCAAAGPHLMGGTPEITLTWTCPRTGLACKGRIDWLGTRSLVDLKTTRRIDPQDFARDAARYKYAVKLAWYRDGAALAGAGRLPVVIIAAENEEPFDVVVYRVPEEALEMGRRVYEKLLDRLQECRLTNRWPGLAEDEEMPLELPAWAFGQETEETELITLGGVPLSI